MNKLKIGLLYVSLHNQIKRRARCGLLIDRKEFFCIIGRHFLVPKNLRMLIIKEMEEMNLIKQELNGEIRILPCEINLETDVNKLYKMVGL